MTYDTQTAPNSEVKVELNYEAEKAFYERQLLRLPEIQHRLATARKHPSKVEYNQLLQDAHFLLHLAKSSEYLVQLLQDR